MMLRFFQWWVSRKRPALINQRLLMWVLACTKILTVSLQIRVGNAKDYELTPIEYDSWFYLVHGSMLLHIRNDGKPHPRHEYAYVDEMAGDMRVLKLQAGDKLRLRAGDAVMVELFDAINTEDKLLDFPRWMTPNEVLKNTKRQAWLFVVTVGGAA